MYKFFLFVISLLLIGCGDSSDSNNSSSSGNNGQTSALLESIQLFPTSVTAPLGKDITLKAMGNYSDGKTLEVLGAEWSSTDESVATVINGIVTPISEGSTTIMVAKDGEEAVTSKFLVIQNSLPCHDTTFYCAPIIESKSVMGLYITPTPHQLFVSELDSALGRLLFFTEDGSTGPEGFDGLKMELIQTNFYCQALSAYNSGAGYAGRTNWQVTTTDQFDDMFRSYGNMFTSFGWPAGLEYWIIDAETGDGNACNIMTGQCRNDVDALSDQYYVSCSSLP